MEISNKRWSDDELLHRRKDVLSKWPTGQGVDLDEAIEYHKRLPREKLWSERVDRAKKEGETLVEVGLGHATLEQTTEHIKAVQEAGADLLYLHTDTYTRKNQNEKAQKGIEDSIRLGRSVLNGFPVVCHGVEATRRMLEVAKVPVEAQGSSDEEPMLPYEIELAAGHTAGFQHDLQELVLHSKNYPLAKRIQNSQYIAKLSAYYTERGAPILSIVKPVMNGYCPPSLTMSLGLLNLLLTAEQGANIVSCALGLLGNLKQDIASLMAFRELSEEYLQRFGYTDMNLSYGSWPFMGDWPRDISQACGFASMFAVAASLAQLDWIYQKSTEEALGTTSYVGNVQVIKLTKQITRSLRNEGTLVTAEIQEEKEAIKAEARCIVDKTIELGDGDPMKGELKAVELGILDVPFSCWTLVKGKVLGARDVTGAMRYLETGNLPFTKEIIKRNQQKIAERQASENPKTPIDMVVKDLKAYSQDVVGVK